jgi:tellurite resistance protein TehA-like permease
MMAWRYLIRKDRFVYEPGLWGMVFPLGMYASATFELAKAEGFHFLEPLSQVFAFVGLSVWLVTFGAFLVSLRR